MTKITVLLLLALTAFVAGASLDVPVEDQILAKDDFPHFVDEVPQSLDYEDPKPVEDSQAVETLDTSPHRIVGGSVTTVSQYPYAVAMLHNQRGWSTVYTQWCGGTILTSRTILSAAHCYETNRLWHSAAWWRIRVGSTYANSGGTVHQIERFVPHPSYDGRDSDIVVLRSATSIIYIANIIAPATIASATYNLADNQAVFAIGWGAVYQNGPSSEQLRHVQIWTINQNTCRQRYGSMISDRMLCSGWLDVGGRDQCQGDFGGPLIHNGVIVGVYSWSSGCGLAYYPGVNARVSSFTNWITTTANTMN